MRGLCICSFQSRERARCFASFMRAKGERQTRKESSLQRALFIALFVWAKPSGRNVLLAAARQRDAHVLNIDQTFTIRRNTITHQDQTRPLTHPHALFLSLSLFTGHDLSTLRMLSLSTTKQTKKEGRTERCLSAMAPADGARGGRRAPISRSTSCPPLLLPCTRGVLL